MQQCCEVMSGCHFTDICGISEFVNLKFIHYNDSLGCLSPIVVISHVRFSSAAGKTAGSGASCTHASQFKPGLTVFHFLFIDVIADFVLQFIY